MTLHRKNGGAPQPLPESDRDPDGLIWTDLANNEHGREICGWTPAPDPPAYDPGTQRVEWVSDAWTVVDLPPPPAPAPIRIGKYWLFQRFSEDQERQFAKLEHQARNMTPEDLDDPAKEPLFQLQRFLRRLDALMIIELSADQTLQGFELLRLLGVFGDPESQASHDALVPILAEPTPLEFS